MTKLFRLGRMPIWLTLPVFAILLPVFGIQIVRLFLISLNAPDFTAANYMAFFAQSANVRVVIQTIEISAVATLICLIIGYPTAYLIVAAPKAWRVALIVFVIIPYLTSMLVRTYAWVIILGDGGLINTWLLDLGLISSPLLLLYSRLAVYIGMVHIMLPLMVLPLVSVMLGIDKSLMSAARSMGARPFTAFCRVFLPLSLPGVRSGSLLVFVICLGFYITPAALGGLREAMLSTFIAGQIASAFNIERFATAGFILLAIAVFVLSLLGLDSGGQLRATQPVKKSWLSKVLSLGTLTRYLRELATPYRAMRWRAQIYRPGSNERAAQVIGIVFIALVMFFLLFPGIIVIIMSFSDGPFLKFPPTGLSLQWYRSFFGDPTWTGAAWTSIEIGAAVTILSTVVGTLAAYGLSRSSRGVRSVMTLAILAPITIPVIVVGIAVYLALSSVGLIGSKTGLILAHSIGSIGYVVVIVAATLANFDRRLEQAAMSMRAGPLRTFTRVTLPLIRPGIIGGAVFAFIASFDEVVITSLVSGFALKTLPLKMWENMRHQIDPTIAAVASLLILMAVLWLVLLYVTWWRSSPSKQRALIEAPSS